MKNALVRRGLRTNTQRLIPARRPIVRLMQAGDAVVCHKLSPAAFTNNEVQGCMPQRRAAPIAIGHQLLIRFVSLLKLL